MGILISRLFEGLLGRKNVKLLMVGLDAAGKSTILYKLKLGEVVLTIPTIGFNVETVRYQNINFTVWDVRGGCSKARTLWSHYYQNSQGVIYVVDSSDRERISEARDGLMQMLNSEWLRNVVIIVFANKQDKPNAMSAEEITEELGLHSIGDRKWHVQKSSATTGNGLYEGLDWLSQAIKNAPAE